MATTLGLLLNCINSGLYMANYNLARTLPPCKSDSPENTRAALAWLVAQYPLPCYASSRCPPAAKCCQVHILSLPCPQSALNRLTTGLWQSCKQGVSNATNLPSYGRLLLKTRCLRVTLRPCLPQVIPIVT